MIKLLLEINKKKYITLFMRVISLLLTVYRGGNDLLINHI